MAKRSSVHHHTAKACLVLVAYIAAASAINTCEFAVSTPEVAITSRNFGSYVDYDETTDKYYMVMASYEKVI